MADLDDLIETARKHVITDEERVKQIISFAYGNTVMENDRITRADVEAAVAELWGRRKEADHG